ncbi:MAG: hypothetical protein M3Q75_09670, partial [Gemmatimonadota bacterium]|nr:hypothetical protein [Gemmatimonadota bacterium]
TGQLYSQGDDLASADVLDFARGLRDQQIPLFHVGDGRGIPPLALLDDPKPQPKGYRAETLTQSLGGSSAIGRANVLELSSNRPMRASCAS